MGKCKFDVNGVCYAIECHFLIKCGCKDGDGCVVRMAGMDMIREWKSRVHVNELEPRLTVMQPSVVNVSVPVDGNVAKEEMVHTEGLFAFIERTKDEIPIQSDFDTEQSVILPKADKVKTK